MATRIAAINASHQTLALNPRAALDQLIDSVNQITPFPYTKV
jgi:hypothetical protein